MADIIPIVRLRERKVDYVFECPCGSQHFYLHKGGEIECRGCKGIVEKLEWIYRGMSSTQPP